MKRALVLAALLLLALPSLSQYSSLVVSHPQQWRMGTGTIESATWVVQPKGTYAYCDLYLTFSARGLGFSPADSFEIIYGFVLPEKAVVSDLWLWVGDDIMRALILDSWTASSIYNGIVKRRQDPCLLTRRSLHSESMYNEMRIYPLLGAGTRKVKVSYTIPVRWTSEGATLSLPQNMLRASLNPPSVRIRVLPDTLFDVPRLLELPDRPFILVEDSAAGPLYECDLIPETVTGLSRLTMAFNGNLAGGYLFATHSRKGEEYFQMALLPNVLLQVPTSRHVALLLDLDSSSARLGTAELLACLRSFLLSRFTASDSFNIIYRSLSGVRVAGRNWFSGGQQGVEAAMDSVAIYGGPRYQAADGSVPEMLKKGIESVHDRGGDGSVLFLTSSSEYVDYRIANDALNELRPWFAYKIPVNVCAFGDPYSVYLFLDGQYWYGNAYFNKNVAQQTGGVLLTGYDYSSPSSGVSGLLEQVEPFLVRAPDALEVTVVPAGGLTYQRCALTGEANSILSWTLGLMEVGKYVGNPPFTVNISALYRDQVYLKTFEIEGSSVTVSDSTLTQRWTGDMVRELEASPPTNRTAEQVLKLALEERVLSDYTSFLALEPNDTLPPCFGCKEESGDGTTAVKENEREKAASDDSLIVAYPNPFNSSTRINVRLPKDVRPEQARLILFNVLGQVVRTFDATVLSSASLHTYTWDGTSDRGNKVSSGVYFLTLATPKGIKTTRLLLAK